MTISGVLIAGIFFFMHPPSKLFSGWILATISLQFMVHFVTMYLVRKMTLPYVSM